MSIDSYTDYIKEDTWYGPTFQSTDAYSQHDSFYPHTPAFDIDFEVLRLIAQDEIQAVEQAIGKERNQSRWEWDEVPGGLENHWETVETVFSSNHRGMSPTPDTCASTWSTLALFEALPPNIQNETSPIQGPTLYYQPTKPSVNGSPLEHAKNFMPGLHLEARTRITDGVSNPFLQAAASVTFASHMGATHDISDRSMGLSFMQSFPNGPPLLNPQNSAAGHALPSAEEEAFSAGTSSMRNRQRSRFSAPSEYANGWSISRNGALHGSQSSLLRSPVKRATTRRAPPRISGVKRVQSERKKPSSRLSSEELKMLLKRWGFVTNRNAGTFTCPTCKKRFRRGGDAKRHWESSRPHIQLRVKAGNSGGLLCCEGCDEKFSRRDSLVRHLPHCGERKKRRDIYGLNSSGSAQ